MTTTPDIAGALTGRELLSHPFYRRWEAGELRDGELAAYGAQYAHFERQLPRTLAAIVDASDQGVAEAVQANLDDELGSPRPHVELLQSFLDAVGAVETPATEATAALVSLYDGAVDRDVAYAVGVVAAYEVQAAAIANSKAVGLRSHYALSAQGTSFWDIHGSMEADHAQWLLEAGASLDEVELLEGVRDSRDAWWAFLDDREAAAA